MNYTDQLKLPYLAAGQAQKHVTLNESLRALDALVQLSLKSRTASAPPATPENGARYLIPAGGSGAWEGKSGLIAAWQDGAWAYFTPHNGWRAWIEAEAATRVYDGTSWVSEGGSTILDFDILGINANASSTNRLTVKSPVSLFDAEQGDHRLTINKAALANTASTVFQTNYSGRAEFGLTGSDDFQLKTSPDGITWANVLTFDKSTGLGLVKGDPTQAFGIATKHYVDTLVAANAGQGGTSSGEMPAGAVAHFAMSAPPSGWLKANGAAVSRATYAALFAAIGTVYGAGDGATTFNLPDLRGEFIRGWDDGRGVDAGRILASAQLDAFQGHYHRYGSAGGSADGTPLGGANTAYNIPWESGGPALQVSYQSIQSDGTNGNPRVAPETRPRNIALLACIKT